ncbi:protein-tyrosine kinase [uncultured Alistipes sp.]|uniref:protein-tyrosine kinase n=1 Tax=uncultured Alistipes sp. TaxID=538949 RepID=UPI0028043D0A|nr:protein-tyrosine kinase [uncultured Alistipes sp.]
MSAREIEFGSITIDAENNHVTVTCSQDGTVWMTETEIARLFGFFPVAIRNNIRAIYKDKRMNEYRTHQITGRSDLYSLEMIAALSFRVRTMESEAFREWLLYRPQHKMVVMQIESDELCPVS